MTDAETPMKYDGFPTDDLYQAIDWLNELRDQALENERLYGHIMRNLHNVSQAKEWRSAGATTADMAPLMEGVIALSEINRAVYTQNLRFNKRARKILEKAFKFDHPLNLRGMYDGVNRGCSC